MRGLNQVRPLCRRAFPPAISSVVGKRYASRESQPYILPRLVIDLDAADSKFVRRVESMPAPPSTAPQRNRKAGAVRPHEAKKLDQKQPPPQLFLKSHNVTPVDLLSYVLAGNPLASGSGFHPYLQSIVERRSISPFEKPAGAIEQLTHGFSTDGSRRLSKVGFKSTAESFIIAEFGACSSLTHLSRLISILSTTQKGCEFLARNGSTLSLTISRIDPPAVCALPLLNNLYRNFETKGVPLGPDLLDSALYWAAHARSSTATQIYLRLGEDFGYKISDLTFRKVELFLEEMGKNYSRR